MKNFITLPRLFAALFFAVFLAIGLLLVDDYGISWDEITQLEIGKANYRYLVKGDPALLSLRDRYYGPLFEVFLVRMMDQSSPRAMYLSRHLWTFLSFYVGVAAFYLLGRMSFKSEWLALLGSALLAASPRIFADSFYNSKDIPFLCGAIFTALSLLYYLRRPGWKRLLLHVLFSAALMAVRMAGLYVLGLTAVMLLVEVIARRMALRRALRDGLVYLLLTLVLGLLLYPVLWSDPLGKLREGLQAITAFPYYSPVLFQGSFHSPQELPWSYLPVWIGVTTPLAYLALFVLGCGVAVGSGLLAAAGRERLLALAWVFGPLGAVVLLNPALYDGWRQMFFIYPGVVLLAVEGAGWLARQVARRTARRVHWPVGVVVVVALLGPVVSQMAALHPYQNVYFNRLAGSDMQTVKQRFDLDYWGLSYREGLEYILSIDRRESIPVYGDTTAALRSAAILGDDGERRLHFVYDPAEADYYLGNYRWHPQDYPYADEIYTVWVGNAKILSVFRLNG